VDYKVKLEIFEGPLDLLLYLIRKNELDIYDIPVALVTEQYLEYIELMKALNLDVAGEFLVMASTLTKIKSQMLLPQASEEEEEPEEDPRAALVARLLEYQKYKEAAGKLQERDLLDRDVFVRDGLEEDLSTFEEEGPWIEASLFDLIGAMEDVLKKETSAREAFEVIRERISIQDKIALIMKRVKEEKGITFTSLFEGMVETYEIVVTFLALLELMRIRALKVLQSQLFGEIRIFAIGG
jgi:segregation and condensation protein A